jgi:hypothetical protein
MIVIDAGRFKGTPDTRLQRHNESLRNGDGAGLHDSIASSRGTVSSL